MPQTTSFQLSDLASARPLHVVAAAAVLTLCAGCVNTRSASTMPNGSETPNQSAAADSPHGGEAGEPGNPHHQQHSAPPGSQFATGDSNELSIHDTPEGRDTFVLAAGEGSDTVLDFNRGQDKIGLAGTLAFNQLAIAQGTGGAIIKFGVEVLAQINGVNASSLTANQFVSVPV